MASSQVTKRHNWNRFSRELLVVALALTSISCFQHVCASSNEPERSEDRVPTLKDIYGNVPWCAEVLGCWDRRRTPTPSVLDSSRNPFVEAFAVNIKTSQSRCLMLGSILLIPPNRHSMLSCRLAHHRRYVPSLWYSPTYMICTL